MLADKHYVGQVLVNLIINSIHYGREGGTTNVRFRDMLDRILIEVEDNGQGIGKEDIPRIFERFYRTDKALLARAGAARAWVWPSSSNIVEAHGEHVAVRSEPGSARLSVHAEKGRSARREVTHRGVPACLRNRGVTPGRRPQNGIR